MADHPQKPFDQTDLNSTQNRVQELAWAMLDDRITDQEMDALDKLLANDETARIEYLQCVQMHADLHAHFAARSATGSQDASQSPPILGFLKPESLPLELQTPPAQDVTG